MSLTHEKSELEELREKFPNFGILPLNPLLSLPMQLRYEIVDGDAVVSSRSLLLDLIADLHTFLEKELVNLLPDQTRREAIWRTLPVIPWKSEGVAIAVVSRPYKWRRERVGQLINYQSATVVSYYPPLLGPASKHVEYVCRWAALGTAMNAYRLLVWQYEDIRKSAVS